jgi:hypothetical protein
MPRKSLSLTAAAIALASVAASVAASAPPLEAGPGHWAFVRPVRPEVPEVAGREGGPNPIDAFIRARLEAEGIEPSPEADRFTLVRRLYIDLTGLPPKPAEVDAFVGDTAPGAYERLVDRLLASPHFGERWARWWLDLARYADSNGYSIDAPRSIWLYRDWVIGAMNRDLPFDQFVVQQVAGDMLAAKSENAGRRDELGSPETQLRIATGFHRNTQINEEGGIDKEQFRIEAVVDRLATTGTAFLGLTLACAQCHDHKYDPVSQKEYYELFAVFNNQDEPTLTVPDPNRAAGGATGGGDEPPPGESRRGRGRGRDGMISTLVMAERDEPRESHVYIKGDFTRHGERVYPGVPAALHPVGSVPAAAGPGFDRLAFAYWLASPENPLLARVTVNRVWQQYFGKGIVETENDFGLQGLPPSHPELLDWLAVEFMEGGWSLKRLHKLIATSAAYRQSSHARPDLAVDDPGNRLLARQNRLRFDAEIVRDVALAASGLLSDKVGGPGVHPPQPDGVMSLGQVKREWRAAEGDERYRRGMYTFFYRATPYPSLAVFDAPDAFSACSRRPRSNTPLQALTLLNDQAFFECAQGLAKRVVDEAPEGDAAGIEHAFRLCLGRPPQVEELEALERLLAAEREGGTADAETAAWTSVARVVLNLDETITRE